VLKSAKRPLIILGKGAAYAQADDQIRTLVEKSGIPFLPMSMAKGLLPDTHPQYCGCCARRCSKVRRRDADRARLNWLLSPGKGKTWGDAPRNSFRSISSRRKWIRTLRSLHRWSAISARAAISVPAGHGRQLAGRAGRDGPAP
jgi:glyoxylate carboligase